MKEMVLQVLSLLYDGVTRLKNYLYDAPFLSPTVSELPVISIGNVTAGGNGKTPLTQSIAKLFRDNHYTPVVLSRGYGGNIRGPHRVTTVDSPAMVGDEPLMMVQSGLPVVIARDRVAGALYIEEHQIGNVILLDDGFQHRRLHRGVDIVSINVATSEAEEAFIEGALLPQGLFRESRDAALQRADIIVLASRSLAKPDRVSETLRNLLPSQCDRFLSHLELDGIVHAESGESLQADQVHAVSAIAHPEGFFNTIRSAGYGICEIRTYRDHATIPTEDLELLREHYPGIPIVCTAKDAVKLKACGETDVYIVKVRTIVEPEQTFWDVINRRMIRDQKIRKDVKANQD